MELFPDSCQCPVCTYAVSERLNIEDRYQPEAAALGVCSAAIAACSGQIGERPQVKTVQTEGC